VKPTIEEISLGEFTQATNGRWERGEVLAIIQQVEQDGIPRRIKHETKPKALSTYTNMLRHRKLRGIKVAIHIRANTVYVGPRRQQVSQ